MSIFLLQIHDNSNEYALKIFLLFLCIIANFSLQLIRYLDFVHPHLNNEDRLGQLSIVIFSVIGFYYILASALVIVTTIKFRDFHMMFKSNREYQVTLFSQFYVTTAGLLYYIGDDLSYFVNAYQHSLGCNSSCVHNVDHTSDSMLYISLLMFTLGPILFDRIKLIEDTSSNDIAEWHWSVIKDTGHAFALIIDLDAWYSTVADVPFSSSEYCPAGELTVAWVMYGFCLFIWAVTLILIYTPGIKLALNETPQNFKKALVYICLLILIWTTTATMLFADNPQPMGCLYGCDVSSSVANTTNCRDERLFLTRVVLLGTVAIVLTVVVAVMIFFRIGSMIVLLTKKKNCTTKKN